MSISTLTGSNAAVIQQMNSASQASAATQKNDTATAQAQLTGNLNSFLTMLTTQLKNQDPLSPTDSTQFTNQLVQYSEVEQQININSNLQTLIGLQKGSSQATAIGYIGQAVSATGSSLPLESGQSNFSYTLPSNASKVSITLQDSAGNTVATMSAPAATAGTHLVSWDGTNASGGKEPDGAYTISIAASDASGNPITATTNVYGTVTGVTADATNGTQLQLGAVNVPLANVTSILPASALASTSSSSSSNSSTTN